MASPATAIERPDLSLSLSEFNAMQERQGFIGMRVLPLFGSQTESGKFTVVPLEAELGEDVDTRRAAGAAYKRDNFKTEDISFQTEERGWEGIADDKLAKIYRNVEKYNRIVARRAAGKVLRDIERKIAAAIYNTSTWTGPSLTTTPSVPWATVATSTPITDVQDAMEKVFLSSGETPNALIINHRQAVLITQSAQYQAKFVATDRMQGVLERNIAAAIGIDRVIISEAPKNTAAANETSTFTIARRWSNNYAMVAKIAESDDLQENCLGRTIFWEQEVMEGDEPYPIVMEQYREEAVRGGVHRARTDLIWKIINHRCGHLLVVGS